MEIDIATLLENHRRHMLAQVDAQDYDNEDELAASRFAVMSAHDRATTKSLLDIYRTANSTQPVGNAAPPTPITTPSRKVKAGSKKARDRAILAGQTRRKNRAANGNHPPAPLAGGPAASLSTGSQSPSTTGEGGAA